MTQPTLGISNQEPTQRETERANEFCHAFIRFAISEGVDPATAMLYVASAAAQVARNVAVGAGISDEDAVVAFANNMLYFMGRMRSDGHTLYPIPRKDL